MSNASNTSNTVCGDANSSVGLGSTQYVVYSILGAAFLLSEGLGLTQKIPYNAVTDLIIKLVRKAAALAVVTRTQKQADERKEGSAV